MEEIHYCFHDTLAAILGFGLFHESYLQLTEIRSLNELQRVFHIGPWYTDEVHRAQRGYSDGHTSICIIVIETNFFQNETLEEWTGEENDTKIIMLRSVIIVRYIGET
jgi:hypothetical protein